MEEAFLVFLFTLPALLSLACCFIKDSNKVSRLVLNTILIINAVGYLTPLIYAYWATFPDGNMWDENGAGAVIWLYVIILPICILVVIVLFILKMVLRKKTKTELH